jgi:hypothetical protein
MADKPPKIQDLNVKPPGYEPPMSVREMRKKKT